MSQSFGIAISGHVIRKIFTYKGTPSVSMNGEILGLYNYNLEASTFQVVKIGDEYFTVSSRQPEKEYHGSSIKDRETYEIEQVVARSEATLETLKAMALKYNMSEADLMSQCAQIQESMEEAVTAIHRMSETSSAKVEPAQEQLQKLERQLEDSEDIVVYNKAQWDTWEARSEGILKTIRNWFNYGYLKVVSDVPLLHVACQVGSLDAVKQIVSSDMYNVQEGLLLEFPLNPFVNEKVFSPMHVALVCGHVPVARYLKYLYPELLDFSTPTRGIPPMLCAAAGGLETFEWMLDQEYDIGDTAANGLTAAHTAAMMDHLNVIKLIEFLSPKLLNQATDADVLPIHCAALKGSLKIIQYFVLKPGYKMLVSKRSGLGLHHYAASGNQVEVLDWLHKRSYDMAALDNRGLRIAHHAALKGAVDALQWITKQGFNPLPLDSQGKTPLDLAKQNNVTATIKFYQDLAKTDPRLAAMMNGAQFSTINVSDFFRDNTSSAKTSSSSSSSSSSSTTTSASSSTSSKPKPKKK